MAEKESLLFIDHDYHAKTKSTDFLLNLFEEKYNVDTVYYDVEKKQFTDLSETKKQYKVLVLFQFPIPVEEIRNSFQYEHAVFFPMFDCSGGQDFEFWLEYRNFTIINFSSTLHKRLAEYGFSTHYIQYFPKPNPTTNFGDKSTAFFWQRVNSINVNDLYPLIEQLGIQKVNLQMTPDPWNCSVYPDSEVKNIADFNIFGWTDSKEDKLKIMENSAVYFAPRMYEGIGMSFLEAMAMGRCVVAVDRPTMNEYIEDGRNGILYDLSEIRRPKSFHIREIQENTAEYIREGYERWESEKQVIFDWLEEDLMTDFSKIRVEKLRRRVYGIKSRIDRAVDKIYKIAVLSVFFFILSLLFQNTGLGFIAMFCTVMSFVIGLMVFALFVYKILNIIRLKFCGRHH